MTTWPEVGSISRVRQRTSVDLPEPDRPITTNTSPGATSNDTSLTPTTQPVFSFRSARESSASGVPRTLSQLRPKIFQRFLTERAASPPDDVASDAGWVVVLVIALTSGLRVSPGG